MTSPVILNGAYLDAFSGGSISRHYPECLHGLHDQAEIHRNKGRLSGSLILIAR